MGKTVRPRYTWAEFLVSVLPIGTPIEWKQRKPLFCAEPLHGVGLLTGALNYDGIMAQVDAGGKRVVLHTYSKGVRIRRLKDTRRLTGPGIGGDGI